MMTTDQNVENWDIQTLLGVGVGMYNGTAISENRLQLLKKSIVINYLSSPRFLAKRKANVCPPTDVSLNVHSSFMMASK